MDNKRLFDMRKATVLPDEASVIASAGGRELARQRNSGQQQKFPDHASYLRYVRGVNYVRTRNIAPPTPLATAPDAPTAVSATAGDSQAIIAFTAPATDGGAAIISYTVTSSPEGITTTGPASPLMITGLTNGTTYTFTVVATNSVGQSVPSAPSSPVTPVTTPSAPTITSLTPGNRQISVAFVSPTSDGGTTITNYKYSTDDGISWIARVPPSLLSPLLITDLTNGTPYQIKLLAVNAVGDGSASVTANATPATIPDAPTSLSATSGNAQVAISFTPGSNGGSAIINYEYSIDNGVTFTEFNPATGAVSSVIITGLANETSHNIKLRAINGVGTGAPSSTVTSTPSVFTRTRFTTVGAGSWTVPSNVNSVEYLVVGGGGGGGGAGGTGSGGGGGGGSVKSGTLSVSPGDVISYTVGSGGTAGVNVNGGDGDDSIFGTIVARGGGRGYESRSKNESGTLCKGGSAQAGDTPATGGSGGGTRNNDAGGGPGGGLGGGGGGGGGAGGSGQDGYDATPGDATSAVGGNGGIGISSDIGGTTTVYGVGGKGGNEALSDLTGAAAAANTGNGGGGAQATSWGGSTVAGGAGGSGIIIIKYIL